MNDPRIVANYMLEIADSKSIALTNLALQKLLFFAHAISLVEKKKALVSGYFEAWQYTRGRRPLAPCRVNRKEWCKYKPDLILR
jgi:uncharacterized phage-associated protein